MEAEVGIGHKTVHFLGLNSRFRTLLKACLSPLTAAGRCSVRHSSEHSTISALGHRMG